MLILNFIACSSANKTFYLSQTKDKNEIEKLNSYEFNKFGNISIVKTNLNSPRFYNIEEFSYNDDQQLIQTNFFHFFKKEKKKILASFKTYEYDQNRKLSKQIIYEKDSTIRVIIMHSYIKNIEINTIYSFEMFPAKNPNLKEAIILTDSIFYDNTNKKIASSSYNTFDKNPSISKTYKYLNNGYYETSKTKNGELERFYKNIGTKKQYFIPFEQEKQIISKK